MPEIGQIISHYQIIEKLGQGGMGEVFLADDLSLGRKVALKFLSQELQQDPSAHKRLLREAKAAAALDHPHICSVHDVAEVEGKDFIVMEHIQGQTLKDRLLRGPLPINEALQVALEAAGALEEAHEKGIIHRDLKPANIMLTRKGHAKVMDFGLAKHLTARAAGVPEAATATVQTDELSLTDKGAVVGTVSYMSPEQVEGKPLDARSDVFSFGAVLYELLTGQKAFRGDSAISTMSAILRDAPVRASKVRPELPHNLDAILNRCLEKNRDLRYASAASLHKELMEFQAGLLDSFTGFRAFLQPRIALPMSLVLAVAIAGAAWFVVRSYRANWARNEALPEIARLTDQGEYVRAFELAERVEKIVPGDKVLEGLWPRLSRRITLVTDPLGATVSMKEYAAIDASWRAVGLTPLKDYRIPRSYFRWSISKEGYQKLETGGPPSAGEMNFHLVPAGSPESGMAWLPDAVFRMDLAGFELLGPWPMEAYYIDRFEVTNQQFRQFVDAGGYRKQEYWQHPFIMDGRRLTWEEAMKRFVDSSGRQGPATWEAGIYREGQDNLPVGGVSWYEAAAYAEYAGKSLPTLYHWYQATGIQTNSTMVPLSNFAGKGVAAVGTFPGVSFRGVYDLAGNHREWTWTETRGRRYCLGGAWNEPSYFLMESEARPPFDRALENGFRCVKYQNGKIPPARYAGTLDKSFRDYSREKPASEEAFRIFERLYPRDTGPLEARMEPEGAGQDNWRKLTVSYSAGYGGERLPAYLFLPKNAVPPYQAVVWFPGGNVLQIRKSDELAGIAYIGFIIQSGRAVLYPIYKGTYERDAGLAVGHQSRESLTWWLNEVRRSVDYLESRPDIDAKRIAYAGLSWGARLASIFLAMESRLRAAVLFSGGYNLVPRSPEIDDFNYTPRVKTPVLMINGRYDFVFPLETSAAQMFKRLGTPDDRKKQVVTESGHDLSSVRGIMMRETLDWLDRYLGAVNLK
jgi:formylglycine-generating enzyme required for sulfatase activity/predicted esterase/predicted Ser/Thr protein kinase